MIANGYTRIDVTSKSVKKLVFSKHYSDDALFEKDYIDHITINAPYISSLTIKGEFVFKLVLLDVSSLIKAELDNSIDPGMFEINHKEILRGLLESLDHVKDVIINDFWWEHFNPKLGSGWCGDNRRLMLAKKLLTLHRASPIAEIKFKSTRICLLFNLVACESGLRDLELVAIAEALNKYNQGRNERHNDTEKAVRIVVVGDRGTGKSSLIISTAAEKFQTPTRLPEDMFPGSCYGY
ncbi:thiamine thiazole synthase, chloroplastic-like protein [Tanacetum coccineum]